MGFHESLSTDAGCQRRGGRSHVSAMLSQVPQEQRGSVLAADKKHRGFRGIGRHLRAPEAVTTSDGFRHGVVYSAFDTTSAFPGAPASYKHGVSAMIYGIGPKPVHHQSTISGLKQQVKSGEVVAFGTDQADTYKSGCSGSARLVSTDSGKCIAIHCGRQPSAARSVSMTLRDGTLPHAVLKEAAPKHSDLHKIFTHLHRVFCFSTNKLDSIASYIRKYPADADLKDYEATN